MQIKKGILITFILSILWLVNSVAIGQNVDCAGFHTGSFKLLDASSPDYTITRNDSIQTETARNSVVTTDFYIRWIDDCNYELTLIKMHNRPVGLKMPENTIKLLVKIYKVSGDTCWVETRANSSEYVSKNRMVKIKE